MSDQGPAAPPYHRTSPARRDNDLTTHGSATFDSVKMRWAMQQKAARLAAEAREAGYEVTRVEQLRSNRWLLTVKDGDGNPALLLVQQRPLVTAADVQDLAEMLQCARVPSGVLLALEGGFSPEARRTAAELRRRPIMLCTAFPPTGRALRGRTAFETA